MVYQGDRAVTNLYIWGECYHEDKLGAMDMKRRKR